MNVATILKELYETNEIVYTRINDNVACFHPDNALSYLKNSDELLEVDMMVVRMNPVRIQVDNNIKHIGWSGQCTCGKVYFCVNEDGY